jgi:hypothetical protein
LGGSVESTLWVVRFPRIAMALVVGPRLLSLARVLAQHTPVVFFG